MRRFVSPTAGDSQVNNTPLILNWGMALYRLGRLEEAETVHREAIAILRTAFGDEHRETLSSRMNLPRVLRDQGRLDEAEGAYREVLIDLRTVFGPKHLWIAAIAGRLAQLLNAKGDFEEGQHLAAESLAIREELASGTFAAPFTRIIFAQSLAPGVLCSIPSASRIGLRSGPVTGTHS